MDDFNKKIDEFTDTPDTTSEYDPADIEKNKTLAIFSYFSWLVIIPLIAAKDSPFAKFHANQGLVLAIAETLLAIVIGVIKSIPYIGFIGIILSGLLSIASLVFLVLGVVNAVNGKAKELPVIGKIRIIK